jgi:signal transduction histidine kinase
VRSGDQVITAVVFAPAAGESPVLVPDAERHQRYAQLSGAGDLAAKLNHNLRNPLASVVAGLSILELSVTLAPEDQQLAATVQSDVGRVTERVREVLDRVRLPPLQPCLVPLGSLVDRLRVVLPDLASEHRVSLRITADDEALLLLLDLPLMERAVLDLVRNAAQAAGDGGQVEVRCERPAPERLARRFPRFVGRVVTLVVDDSGPGIPPERRLEVVRPFVTTRRASAGLGLTLAACAVERHGGSLEISESPLGGARLEVHLPLAPREAVDCELDCWPQELSACAVDVVSRHLLCWSTRGGHFAQTGEVHDGCRQCWVYRSTALHAGAGSA